MLDRWPIEQERRGTLPTLAGDIVDTDHTRTKLLEIPFDSSLVRLSITDSTAVRMN